MMLANRAMPIANENPGIIFVIFETFIFNSPVLYFILFCDYILLYFYDKIK